MKGLGHEVFDTGPFEEASVDYLDYAVAVARRVSEETADRGILICGTGIGMAITANKIPGIHAAICHDDVTAELARRHNNTNVLCLSADLLSEHMMERVVQIWLESEFEGGRDAWRRSFA